MGNARSDQKSMNQKTSVSNDYAITAKVVQGDQCRLISWVSKKSDIYVILQEISAFKNTIYGPFKAYV